MAAAANMVETRRVAQYVPTNGPGGGYTILYRTQIRTKNVTSSILGLIPLSSSWSAWTFIDDGTVTPVDADGNEVTLGPDGMPA